MAENQTINTGPTLSGPTPLYLDDGSAILERSLEAATNEIIPDQDIDIVEFFELNRIVYTINEKGYQKIALQFPDILLKYSDSVAHHIQNHCSQAVCFVLADTSYGSCCIDEVAARHVECDVMVHFGHSCLSGIDKFPVLYSFGRAKLDVSDCSFKLSQVISECEEGFDRVLVLSDLAMSHQLESLNESLKLNLPNLTIHTGQIPLTQNIYTNSTDLQALEISHKSNQLDRLSGRYFHNNVLPIGLKSIENSDEKVAMIYIGKESLELSNLLMTCNSAVKVYRYDPIKKEAFLDGKNTNRMLMKRYVLVQKAKDATTFGIVVGTLGVANYMTMLTHLKTLITDMGGKCYTFVMGKLNVPKLANFMEIDIFVLVACPENSLLDSKEFYKPVVTPYELELALSRNGNWTGKYFTEFDSVLQKQEDIKNDDESEEDEDKPHFSLITGKFVKPRTQNKLKHIELECDGTIIQRDQPGQLALAGSTAGKFLQTRIFQGLQPDHGQTPVEKATVGRYGIARGYKDEKEDQE